MADEDDSFFFFFLCLSWALRENGARTPEDCGYGEGGHDLQTWSAAGRIPSLKAGKHRGRRK